MSDSYDDEGDSDEYETLKGKDTLLMMESFNADATSGKSVNIEMSKNVFSTVKNRR